ncbi:MAG: type II secretion system protein GspN [Kofleriaceae bacterium]
MPLTLLACSQSSTPPEVELGAFDPASVVHETDDAVRVEAHRHEVPLQDLPIVARVMSGLPMSGLADLAIDLTVPKSAGVPHYREATGSIALSCPTGCTLGDGHTRLAVGGTEGLDFGQLVIDKLDVRAEVSGGHVAITKWELASKDLAFDARLRIDLADRLEDSTLDGCLWFKPDPALIAREPKTLAVLQTTGATAGTDGYFEIKVGGRIGERKLLAQACRPR